MKKQAIVIIHGMGEQIPMETLTSFVDAVWTTNDGLVSREKPDPDTGAKTRVRNASWSKPDRRNRSFELRVITTETPTSGKRIDFYEYYWAHLITDTTWAQVRAWILELMLRNPKRDVPRGVLPVWILMWLIAIVGLVAFVWTLKPTPEGVEGSWFAAIGVAAATAVLGWLIGFLVSYFGDVARYVKAKPRNVARRQEIRENGVQLIETLMGIRPDGTIEPEDKRAYDRVIVVAHSLGTIVAYDILTHAFARVNTIVDTAANTFPQDKRIALEEMIRGGLAQPPEDDKSAAAWIDSYQALQAEARRELNETGNPWIVSDFITLGSPLTHAEFLLVRDRAGLAAAKRQRLFPTCPPTLEFDGKTTLHHFTFPGPLAFRGGGDNPRAPRVPHHAALFAYTRWSNLYSGHRWILWGDIISGPLARALGLGAGDDKALMGIRDIAVMPCVGDDGKRLAGDRRPFFSHTRYWTVRRAPAKSHHVDRLRMVLRLGEK